MMRDELEKKKESRIRTIVICSIAPAAAIVGAILISLIIPLFEPRTDPLDVSLNKSKKIVADEIVSDNTVNGFRLVYVTARDVTPARYEEIISRRHITDSLNNLKVDAQRHFGEFLHVDIYDFTSFAIKYHPDPDLVLQNVFVFGKEKQDLYLGPNPRIENPAKWINPKTLQGILYINREDILHRTSGSRRVYRYWRCRAPHNRSDTDEHFSHFSEDEELKPMHLGNGYVVVSARRTLFEAKFEMVVIPRAVYHLKITFGHKTIFFDPKEGKSVSSRTIKGVLKVIEEREDILDKDEVMRRFCEDAVTLLQLMERDGYITGSSFHHFEACGQQPG